MVASPLVDRSDECQARRQVLDTVREGMSQTLVIRGEPGIGKTALLDYVTGLADEFRVERVVGIESEMDFGFAALHQLLMPFLPGLDQLPQPQRDALGSAFGLVASDRDNRFLVALATLSLLANAATDEPILFVIDDAQWLNRESAEILAFVARRLHADRVALLFAVRDSGVTRGILDDLPQLSFGGLPDARPGSCSTRSPGRSRGASAIGSWPRQAVIRWP
jgi:hypothetical protein